MSFFSTHTRRKPLPVVMNFSGPPRISELASVGEKLKQIFEIVSLCVRKKVGERAGLEKIAFPSSLLLENFFFCCCAVKLYNSLRLIEIARLIVFYV